MIQDISFYNFFVGFTFCVFFQFLRLQFYDFFGILIIRHFYLNATHNIEDVNPAIAGFLGGLGLPIIFSWIVGGLFAAEGSEIRKEFLNLARSS